MPGRILLRRSPMSAIYHYEVIWIPRTINSVLQKVSLTGYEIVGIYLVASWMRGTALVDDERIYVGD